MLLYWFHTNQENIMDYTVTANYDRPQPQHKEDVAPVYIPDPANYGEEF
jgi:hypothetical protein